MCAQVELQVIQQSCHALIPGLKTTYGYTPSQAAGIVFVTPFGLSMCLHTTQMAWKRNWWCLVFVLGFLSTIFPTPPPLLLPSSSVAIQIAKRKVARPPRPLGSPSKIIPLLLGTPKGAMKLATWLSESRFFEDTCPRRPLLST
ncbi:hypothetical protein TSTA_001260 [Talaromyces stipitatus ATCC 10500]|uniref:Uncharacterized protein n=1 Tax=Talaromyces stipitatus (strain ATCC 10500 / CBS 375.48 / QM 6759 / NRRL 1006) TaxID=441959 RepID=B8MS10_TALSN|nr:uncharacterized protein TSTA_001260 [Talaromyces stipitatus ATCC 10500]EED12055.1 hypothetical protein TSTA_001260 [Talaromyces stipitatus ATCC 10500]